MSSASSSAARIAAAAEVATTGHTEKTEKRTYVIEEDAAKKQESEKTKGSINIKNTEMKRKQEEGYSTSFSELAPASPSWKRS